MERDYTDIDTQKSIQTGRLSFKNSFTDLINALFIVLFFTFLVGIFVSSLYKDFSGHGDIDIIYLILKVAAVIIFSYVVFRKLTEKKLFSITTNVPKDKARQILDNYFERLKYRKSKSTADMVNYADHSTFIGAYNYFIFPLDNKILFTVVKDQNRLPLPAIITLWTTRGDLKKLLSRHS